jgi:hypothetical protein
VASVAVGRPSHRVEQRRQRQTGGNEPKRRGEQEHRRYREQFHVVLLCKREASSELQRVPHLDHRQFELRGLAALFTSVVRGALPSVGRPEGRPLPDERSSETRSR